MEYFRVKRGRGCDLLFSDLQWVLKARCLDETRFAMQLLLVDETLIGCTDGHRMHIAYNQFGLPSGKYEPVFKGRHEIIFLQINDAGNYPDIFSPVIWKHAKKAVPFRLDYSFVGLYSSKISDLSNLFYQIASKAGACVNIDYLRDACSYDRPHSMSFCKEKNQLFIQVGDMERLAIIMTMRTCDDSRRL